ncbi:hypothetical protein P3X46_016849 [Hevea brasiliensis]|uniref:Uncharacterized protein n=1 Tax=Hevea brasiliensis TaxID=3981 RepID=A0ABQ9M3Z0_HEVBR|nr:hypothetical protein P3X46_016849 [Hevea brasiliensis]
MHFSTKFISFALSCSPLFQKMISSIISIPLNPSVLRCFHFSAPPAMAHQGYHSTSILCSLVCPISQGISITLENLISFYQSLTVSKLEKHSTAKQQNSWQWLGVSDRVCLYLIGF